MNIGTRGSFATICSACRAYAACVVSETPAFPGRVWCPYSVIQTGMFLRLNQVSSDVSKRDSWVSVTFGHLTFCVGGEFGSVGYGCWPHASNLSAGFCRESSWANLPGDTVSCRLPCGFPT